MAKEKKQVREITSMSEDFAQWYTDVVVKAGLIGYTSVKGCMALKPAGYAIWENIQHELDKRFKETGVENVYNCIHILVCSRLDQTIHPAHYADFCIRKATLQCLCILRVHHRNQFRVKFTRLFFQKRNIFISRNGGNTDIT